MVLSRRVLDHLPERAAVLAKLAAAVPATFQAAGLVDVRSDVGTHLMRAAESAPITAPVLRRTRERALELGLASAP
jgi:hypothetical protein